MNREELNPEYAFLFDKSKSEHQYYKWKLHSLMQGDTMETWKTTPFKMTENGPLWYPPPCPSVSGEQFSKSFKHQQEWDQIITNLTLERKSIMQAMGFAFDHSSASPYIVESITNKIIDSTTDNNLAYKLSLLFLTSDILFNASTVSLSIVADAPKFRILFLKELDKIFAHLELISKHDHFFREEVVKLCNTWTKWNIFDVYKIDEWRDLFK
jgi:U2-associated protein SR140